MQAGKWGVEVKVFYLRNMRRVLQVTPPILTKGKPSPVCVCSTGMGSHLEGTSREAALFPLVLPTRTSECSLKTSLLREQPRQKGEN